MKGPQIDMAGYWSNTLGQPQPDLTGAACATARGRWVMGRVHIAAQLTEARSLCGSCPVRTACLDWAITNEQPAGAWDGVYGGLTQKERARCRR